MAKFVLLKGLVLFGGTWSLFLLVLIYRNEAKIRDLGVMSAPDLMELTHRLRIHAVAYGLAAGLLWGLATWWLSEATYKRLKRRADPTG